MKHKSLSAVLSQGRTALRQKNLPLAEQCALQLLKANSDETQFLSFAGQVFLAAESWEKAERCYRRAHELVPEHLPFMITLAETLCRLRGRQDEAVRLAEQVLDSHPTDARILMSMGSVYSQAERYERAYALFTKGLSFEPDNPELCYMAATTARFLGHLADAEAHADRCVRLDPDNYEGLFLRSDVRKQTPEHNHIAELEARIAAGFTDRRNQYHHYFTLAKEHEDLGHYDASFAALKSGAVIRRGGMAYKVEHDVEVMTALKETFSESFFAQERAAGCGDEGPIFIVGMPRTGTTLLERVIASQGEATAAGELNELSLMISHIVRSLSGKEKLSKLELVRGSSKLDFFKLGQTYLHATKKYARGKSLWIDKMHINFLYCGLIHLSMPNAKMINLVRHPMDTCYSNFKMLFNAGAPYSYALEDLGHYYVSYHQLMEHWQAVLPSGIHQVEYESLTTNFEATARRALDFCGLPWNNDVLDFHKNAAASTTASASQVRQPLYQSSVARWRNYEKQLEPLRAILEAGGVPIG